MSWVKARAYRDGQFLLERLFSQVASDVHEVNRLPAKLRFNYTFGVLRKPDAPVRFSVTCKQGETYGGAVLFVAGSDSVSVVRHHAFGTKSVACRWDDDAGEERWFDQAVPDVVHSVSEMSEYLLEAFYFNLHG